VVAEEEYDVWRPRSVGKNPCVVLYTFLILGNWKNKTSSQPIEKKNSSTSIVV